jgi:putative peptidoglycan lipid II flippase
MLAAAVVPLLAGPLASGDRVRAGQLASALLTWALLALGAVTVAVMLVAGPLSGLLLGHVGQQGCPGAQDLGRRMLLTFAPQILLYGVGIILGGILQAGRRFSWPALAPLISSLVVIAAYLLYGSLAGANQSIGGLSGAAELALAGGTTAGVAALALCQAPAVFRLSLPVHLTLRFPAGAAGLARAAILAGTAALAGQQICAAVTLRLANDASSPGLAVVATLAQAVFLLPWAVLAVPVATSAFPRLAAYAADGDIDRLRHSVDRVLGLLLTLCAAGAAALFATAEPVSTVLLDRSAPGHRALAPAVAILAAGLLGWSAVALLARALYATGHFRAAASGQVIGWVVAIAAAVALSSVLADRDRAAALSAGYAIGVTVSGALLTRACVRRGLLSGGGPLARRVAICGLAAIAGGLAGSAVGRVAHGEGILASIGLGLSAAGLASVVAMVAATAGRDPHVGLGAVRRGARA